MKTVIAPSIHDRRRAFSLIEIMVAVTLLSVITIGLLAMFYNTQRAFKIGTSQVDVLEGGRAIMQLVTRELQEVHHSHIDTVANFEAEPSGTVRIIMNLPVGNGRQRTNLLQNISFLTRRGDEWSAISYRVQHNNRGAGTLYRGVLSTNIGTVLETRGATVRDQRMVISNLFARITLPFNTLTNTGFPDLTFDRIADGIVHFQVHAYSQSGFLYTNANYLLPEGYTFTNFVPAYLDVELGIVEPKAMKQFEIRATGPAGATQRARDYMAQQAYRTHLFKQRVSLRARRPEYDFFAAQ